MNNKVSATAETPDFDKNGDGLVPVVVQDAGTLEVLMLGYMNREAWDKTLAEQRVTFYSRSKKRLWTKGEESGHYLEVTNLWIDCDRDTVLVQAHPAGPTCHTGHRNCFGSEQGSNFIFELERIVADRYAHPQTASYINRLRGLGLNKIAQKVGEEGVETVIAALAESREDFVNEASDLLFHLLVLLREKEVTLAEIAANLADRHRTKE